MKKFFVGLIFGLLISICNIAYASETIKAILFPVKYTFNGQERALPSNYKTLNIDGDTYVPTRFLVENMRSNIAYDESDKTINVQFPSFLEVKSDVHSNKEKDIFSLFLFSEKASYKKNEFMNIRADLRYKGDSNLALEYSGQFMGFYIEDQKGKRSDLGGTLALFPLTVKPGDEYHRIFPQWLLQQYNYDYHNPDNKIHDTRLLPNNLPAGTYKIGVEARYFLNHAYKDTKTLSTEIEITIE
ncbi:MULTISPECIES: stalk domain-containing protein [unclassified Paenibacillus]|uniref:stalk domain-containing protein n=1 Tax=unclassified Paenibacillus TaxID=185978 RepID=UPI00363D7B31